MTHKICSKSGCTDEGVVKASKTSVYCEKHYRFLRMMDRAKRRGKEVPTWEQCEEMLKPCLDDQGNLSGCPCCGQQLQWRSGEDKKKGSTISLQHDLSSLMHFICHSCNVGHGHSHHGDDYLTRPKDHSYCTACKTEKHVSQFYKDKASASGRKCRCRECYREYMRKRRANKKSQKLLVNM